MTTLKDDTETASKIDEVDAQIRAIKEGSLTLTDFRERLN